MSPPTPLTKFCTKKRKLPVLVTSVKNTCFSGIPTLALSKSGYRSKVVPSSQPVIQAPVCSIVVFIINRLSQKCNRFYIIFPFFTTFVTLNSLSANTKSAFFPTDILPKVSCIPICFAGEADSIFAAVTTSIP